MDVIFSSPLALDVTLVVVVLLFAALGARRGLVLSLCSLVGLLLALVLGSLAADLLASPLSAWAAPLLQERLGQWFASGGQTLDGAEGFLPSIARTVLEQGEWAADGAVFLGEFTQAVAQWLLHPLLFFLFFLLTLLLWRLVSRGLDLVARLPVLHTLNSLGGFLFGALKGVILLLLVHLLLRAFLPDLLPEDLPARSRILTLLRQAPAFFHLSFISSS